MNAWHSRQDDTAQRVGAPQRVQEGVPTGSSSATQDAHQSGPGDAQPAHERGRISERSASSTLR